MRSVFARSLRRAFAKSVGTFQPGRRVFLQKGIAAAVAMTLPLGGCSLLSSKTSVAIVGAGIAGLTAAYQLKKLGVPTTLYEATGRVGGRILTVEDAVVDGAHVDFGAEYVDGSHVDLLELCKQLRVELIDLREDKLIPKLYYFKDKKFTEQDLVEALQPFAGQMKRDADSIPAELHYSQAEKFMRLDSLSVAEYLHDLGIEGWLYSFFEVSMKSEYAMDIKEQSALNLLTILSLPVVYHDQYHLYGKEHEVMKIKGGTQKLVDRLLENVKEEVRTGWELKEINRSGKETELVFQSPEGKQSVVADHVILAMPFTVLRTVKMNFEFSDRKRRCVQLAGFGNASKVAMGFHHRVWRDQGYQGYAFTDINEIAIWDSSAGVKMEQGSLTFVTGGRESDAVEKLSYPEIERRLLAGAESVYPGLSEQFNKRISRFCWQSNPYSKGSYTTYKKGQWADFIGVEGEVFENIHFAGEHCSIKHQGFMNGAVETAKRAVLEIMVPPPLLQTNDRNNPYQS